MDESHAAGNDVGHDEEVGNDRKLQWTVKGIDPKVRELSRRAAQRSGMRVGSWVELKLRQAAEQELDGHANKAQAEVLNKLEENANILRDVRHDLHLLQRGFIEKLVSK